MITHTCTHIPNKEEGGRDVLFSLVEIFFKVSLLPKEICRHNVIAAKYQRQSSKNQDKSYIFM
jgi:hypothetical protein